MTACCAHVYQTALNG